MYIIMLLIESKSAIASSLFKIFIAPNHKKYFAYNFLMILIFDSIIFNEQTLEDP